MEVGKTVIVGAGLDNIGSAIDIEISNRGFTSVPLFVGGERDTPSETFFRNSNAQNLVVSCGYMKIESFREMRVGEMGAILRANLFTPLLAIQNFLRATDNHSPEEPCCVVVIGSYGHDHILSNSVPYCAAKAGINHAIKCLAWDYTPKGYRFHCVNPHSVEDTPMTRQVIEQIQLTKEMDEAEAMAYWRRTMLLPNRLTRKEVAKTVTWLLFDYPTMHLSGTSIELYGGER